jgi:signal transduction histidine kinase
MTTSEITKQLTNIVTDLINGEYFDIFQNTMDIEIEQLKDNDQKELFNAIIKLVKTHKEANQFISQLSKGNLDIEAPNKNLWLSPYKQLQSNLNHLVWQTQRISEGDYNQHIDFLGDLSVYFNKLITSLKEKQEVEIALKESETKFKEIINQINDGISVYNEQNKIVVWNKGAEKITGLNSNDVINKNIVDIQHQIAPQLLKDKTLAANVIKGTGILQKPKVFNQIIDDEIIQNNSENLRNIQSVVFPIKFIDYNLFCMVFRDITDVKQYEKELLRLNADKDLFISILAHDLKSPFNALLGFSELLTENIHKYDIAEIENHVNRINKSAQNTYKLLEDLLKWSRAQSGKIPFEPQKLSFTDICKDILEILKPNADAKNITINYNPADEINIFADIDMLKTVLRNLVSNAIKFTSKNGAINIRAEENSGNVTISVSDNGTGIAPDNLTKLFDITQIQTSTGTAEETGTGLGLILCKEFVEKHRGKIWAESEVGAGSDFKFTMPIFAE